MDFVSCFYIVSYNINNLDSSVNAGFTMHSVSHLNHSDSLFLIIIYFNKITVDK